MAIGFQTLSLRGWTIGAALAAALVCADAATAGANAREHRQRERIAAGVQDGSLTRREAHRLRHQQVRIERREQRMRRDGGGLGPAERVRLDRALDRSSARIYRQRHDAQTR